MTVRSCKEEASGWRRWTLTGRQTRSNFRRPATVPLCIAPVLIKACGSFTHSSFSGSGLGFCAIAFNTMTRPSVTRCFIHGMGGPTPHRCLPVVALVYLVALRAASRRTAQDREVGLLPLPEIWEDSVPICIRAHMTTYTQRSYILVKTMLWFFLP